MPRKRRFTRRILNSTRQASVQTHGGLYVRTALTYDVDLTRLESVVVRVTRALYWYHHNHVRLPDDCEVKAWSEDGLRGMAAAEVLNLQETIVTPLFNNPVHSVGRGVLRYRYASGGREHVTAWLLEFYGDVKFLAITFPSAAVRAP